MFNSSSVCVCLYVFLSVCSCVCLCVICTVVCVCVWFIYDFALCLLSPPPPVPCPAPAGGGVGGAVCCGASPWQRLWSGALLSWNAIHPAASRGTSKPSWQWDAGAPAQLSAHVYINAPGIQSQNNAIFHLYSHYFIILTILNRAARHWKKLTLWFCFSAIWSFTRWLE